MDNPAAGKSTDAAIAKNRNRRSGETEHEQSRISKKRSLREAVDGFEEIGEMARQKRMKADDRDKETIPGRVAATAMKYQAKCNKNRKCKWG